MFRISGKLKQLEEAGRLSIEFTDDKTVYGDSFLLDTIEEYAKAYRGRNIPGSNYKPATEKPLDDGLAIVFWMRYLCTDIKAEGDIPKLRVKW
ncbi:hypothetical protein [Ectobacillus panaciterrae]|uniref:hypothetical protein n=1 Tax=Ectobacillus panaciterrae TaxID=363872 RepID=UPI00041EF2B9|nr:hypothetical protein [Ectobacillus panaciterrae]